MVVKHYESYTKIVTEVFYANSNVDSVWKQTNSRVGEPRVRQLIAAN